MVSYVGNLWSPRSRVCGIISLNCLDLVVFSWLLYPFTCSDPILPVTNSTMTETLLFSLLMSSMTCTGSTAYLGLNPAQLKRVFVMFSVVDAKERWLLGTGLGAILGAWIGVWPIPLDWEVWWQAWPIPCFTGAIFGYVLSLVVLLLGRFASKSDSDKVRKD